MLRLLHIGYILYQNDFLQTFSYLIVLLFLLFFYEGFILSKFKVSRANFMRVAASTNWAVFCDGGHGV